MSLNRNWLRPLPAHAVLQDPDWHIWGGGMMRTSDGVCHLLVARWERRHGFPAWITHSEIAHATAPAPSGPYTIQGTALGRREPGFWDSDNAHNPMILAHGGRYYLYYTGNTGDGDWWTHRNHQRIGVAAAVSGIGHALLAALDDAEVAARCPDAPATLLPSLARARRRGFAYVVRHRQPLEATLAVPVGTPPYAALALAGVLDAGAVTRLRPRLQDAARHIESTNPQGT